jgi:uncharacterized protein YukE
MPITLADIDRWDPAAVRDVSTALGKRGASADEVRGGLGKLPMIATWQGSGGDAARAALDRLSKHLAGHADEMAAIASATSKSADEIEGVKDTLKGIYRDARSEGFSIDPETGTVTPLDPGRSKTDPVYWIEQKDLETRIGKVLTDANAADADLARALTMAGNDATGPAEDRPDVRAQMSNPPTDPQQFRDFWDKLSPEEKDWMYDQDHAIGNHGGMPYEPADHLGRNHYNRLHLTELQANAQAQVDQLAAAHPGWVAGQVSNPKGNLQTYRQWQDWKHSWDAANHTLDGYKSVDSTLHAKDGIPRLLGFIDDQGHAAASIGNPDTATHTATLVPGTGQDLAAFQSANDKSMKMYDAAIQADQTLRGHLAVTTWMGYDRPMDVFEAGSTDPARNGAGGLDSYLSGAQASHQGAPSIDTVVGHSYGSTLVGAAASGGHHLPAENIIGVGSPGMLVGSASDLSLDPGGQVYAARAQHDIIQAAVGTVLGPDPTWNGFGAVEIQASPGPTMGPPALDIPSIVAHSSYWDIGNPALADMGAVIAGKPPPFTVPPN